MRNDIKKLLGILFIQLTKYFENIIIRKDIAFCYTYKPQDVAAFLEEMETTEVLLDAVLRSQSARVTVSVDVYKS